MSRLQEVPAALVHEWLVTWGGSESVVKSMTRILPDAPLHCGVWAPDERTRLAFQDRDIRTTWLQKIPGVGRHYRWSLPAMPAAFKALDLSGFELVLSSSHAFSKGVQVDPGAVHVCYCHTPPRYIWDLADEYHAGVGGRLVRPLLPWLRRKDVEAAQGVTWFLANSAYVAERIRRIYGREAVVLHPPVDVDLFTPGAAASPSYFLAGGRMVVYKRLDRAVKAATLGGFPLKVFGDGPERANLERLAGPTVEFLGRVSDLELVELARGCEAFLFPGEEDFGILPVEIQAAGRPVLAWNRGGARETVVHGETGLLFDDPHPLGLVEAVEAFQSRSWSPEVCRNHALKFRREDFEDRLRELLERALHGGPIVDPADDGRRMAEVRLAVEGGSA
ncbi:MAG: glycosyltransferase [Gemmatimonadota bacterium]